MVSGLIWINFLLIKKNKMVDINDEDLMESGFEILDDEVRFCILNSFMLKDRFKWFI